MSVVGLAVAFVVLVVIAVLAPIFGVDSRPTADDPSEGWYRNRA
jgi:hypothetical protein